MERLPEGKAIGEMQASLQWIFTHTSRFAGAVRITAQDGEGFLLVQKGEPLAAYFKHPLKSLAGPPALKYFGSQPILDFGLRKYGPEELQEALAVSRELQALLQPGCDSPAAGPSGEESGRSNGTGTPLPAGNAPPRQESGPLAAVLQQPGVTAVACFADGLCVSSAGAIDAEYTVVFAEELLRWAESLQSATPASGAFMQMTIFYRGGNVIIAPRGDEYLCIFTTPDVQFGQVRRMIRDLQEGA
ncbi:roadblock/LC7 domain-containing protein [Methanoculleus caldifontis]|nr:roadblock/LC7 domain-containing protein [Methanoculleus sp. Wushi-C6]